VYVRSLYLKSPTEQRGWVVGETGSWVVVDGS